MLYTVYRTTNLINSKVYIGFHSINNYDDIICVESINGSIFNDGYMGSGKLIKRALQKYGPINFKQSLVFISDDKKEAELLEKEIVNIKWIKSDDNYNVSIGGNVTILFGEDNGFYNKKHTRESIEKIQKSRNQTKATKPFSWCEIVNVETGDQYTTYSEIYEKYNLNNRNNIYQLIALGVLKYKSKYLNDIAIKNYNKREKWISEADERLATLKENTSNRFKGIPKTPESNIKRGKSISRWIKNNPIEHKLRMDKINKNPEKIRKSAEKHIGMKRTELTKKNISESLKGKQSVNKGKIFIFNLETNERKTISKFENIPTGWNRGYGNK